MAFKFNPITGELDMVGSGGGGTSDHGSLTGLSDDDHTQYAYLQGRSGGQVLYGGTGAGEYLHLRSTSNATKGGVVFDTAWALLWNEASRALQQIGNDGADAAHTITAHSNTPSHESDISLRRTRGTSSSKTATQTDDNIGAVLFSGYDGAGVFRLVGYMLAQATENHSATGMGGKITFLTTENGTTTPVDRVVIDHDGTLKAYNNVDLTGTSLQNVVQTEDIDFGGYAALAQGAETGATLPTTNLVDGRVFLHTPTGRKVLMQYDATAGSWVPVTSFGAVTIYVDSTNGTDQGDNGGTSGSGAFKTVGYAVDQLPSQPSDSNRPVIYLSGDTFTEDVTVSGKANGIKFIGTLSTLDSLTASSGVQGGTATQGTVVRNSGTWTANQRQHKLVKFTSGNNNGVTSVIDSNTSTTLTIVDMWDGGITSGDTFIVEDWATNITGDFLIDAGQGRMEFEDIKFTVSTTGTNTPSMKAVAHTQFTATRCYFGSGVRLDPLADGALDTCFVESQNATNELGVYLQAASNGAFYRSKAYNFKNMIRLLSSSNFKFQQGSIIDTIGTRGIWADRNSVCRTDNNGRGYPRARNYSSAIAIEAERGGVVTFTAFMQYDGSGTNEDGNSGSDAHGYID